jgi:hypothetical protein
MNAICIAIRADGEKCTAKCKAVGDRTRCGVHHNSRELRGPNATALAEIKYTYNNTFRQMYTQYREDLAAVANHQQGVALSDIYSTAMRLKRQEYEDTYRAMLRAQNAEILRTGVNPDAAATQRRTLAAAQRRLRALQQNQERLQLDLDNRRREMAQRVQHPPVIRDLAAFATDAQNVHTTQAVKQTKEIVERVRKIPVPEGYRWNKVFVSKTIGEIISDCQLSSHAAAHMFNHYVSAVAVYDIEEGIYGKVLDSVWQYVKNSPNKEDLCKILKQEMTDNVGMCAQGNLSRICNILAGYMEGIGSQESVAERLGRLLPPLMEIEDVEARLRSAFNILKDNGVPMSDWDTWVDPLVDEDDMVIDVEYIKHEMLI